MGYWSPEQVSVQVPVELARQDRVAVARLEHSIRNDPVLHTAAQPGGLKVTNQAITAIDAAKVSSGDLATARMTTNLPAAWNTGTGYDASRLTVGNLALGAGQNVGFFGAAATTQRARGANLTNNVTGGGVNDVIADFADLVIYANDAAAIRNNLYQLGRALKDINDGLRTLGLFS